MPESLILTIAGQARTGKSTVAKIIAENNPIAVVRPSLLVELYAAEHKLPLSRDDRSTYDDAYFALDRENPHHLTDSVFELTLRYPLVIIDGLRVYRDAKLFKDALGDRYRSVALTAPDPVRNVRDNVERAKRGAGPLPLQEFLASEQANALADYDMADVIGMHDISPEPIDTTRFPGERAVAAHVWRLIRPNVRL